MNKHIKDLRVELGSRTLPSSGKAWVRSPVPQEKDSIVREIVEPRENLHVDCIIRVRNESLIRAANTR